MELGALKGLQKINLSRCKSWETLPAGIGGLTALREIYLSHCSSLKELPVELGALTQLEEIRLWEGHVLLSMDRELPALLTPQPEEIRVWGCSAMHTPPPHVVRQGTGAVLEFLRDLAKGDAPCHLIKVVLLGNQRAGKSSLADSLVLGRPVTLADSDRTVGIEVRHWPVGRKSQLVANIYDAAGHRVYRATHRLFHVSCTSSLRPHTLVAAEVLAFSACRTMSRMRPPSAYQPGYGLDTYILSILN